MACEQCFSDWISCGVDEIIVDGGLTPGAEITYFIDNKSATYSGNAIVDEDGKFTINVDDHPMNLFNPYAGIFVLHLGGNCYDPLFCDQYACIEFEVRKGDAVKNTLTCCAVTP